MLFLTFKKDHNKFLQDLIIPRPLQPPSYDFMKHM